MPSVGPLRSAGVTPPLRYYRPIRRALAFAGLRLLGSPDYLASVVFLHGARSPYHKGELWKIIWHNKRWSEDESLTGKWHGGWEGIEQSRDLRYISDAIVNVQTGTGNRIEFWDSHGMPLKNRGKIRRYIDIGRLTKGR